VQVTAALSILESANTRPVDSTELKKVLKKQKKKDQTCIHYRAQEGADTKRERESRERGGERESEGGGDGDEVTEREGWP
jgi:hypothetical protein